MTRPVMFLRTALTEQRIEDLEKQMLKVLEHLGLNDKEPLIEPKGYEGEPGAGEDAPLPEPEKPPSKIAQKVAKGRR